MDWLNYDGSVPAGPLTVTVFPAQCRLYSILYLWRRHAEALMVHLPSGTIAEVELAMVAGRPTVLVVDRRGKRIQTILRAAPDNLIGYFDADGSSTLAFEGRLCLVSPRTQSLTFMTRLQVLRLNTFQFPRLKRQDVHHGTTRRTE